MVWQTNTAAAGTENQQSGMGSGVCEQMSGADSNPFMKNSSQPEAGSQGSTSPKRLRNVQVSVKSEPMEQTSLQSLEDFVNFNDKKPTNGNTTQNEMAEIIGNDETGSFYDKTSVNTCETAVSNVGNEDYREQSQDNKHFYSANL